MARKHREVVRRVQAGRSRTLVTFKSGRRLELGPYVYLRKGDVLEFSPGPRNFGTIRKVFQDRATGRTARVTLYPRYARTETIHISPHCLRVTFKERTAPAEW